MTVASENWRLYWNTYVQNAKGKIDALLKLLNKELTERCPELKLVFGEKKVDGNSNSDNDEDKKKLYHERTLALYYHTDCISSIAMKFHREKNPKTSRNFHFCELSSQTPDKYQNHGFGEYLFTATYFICKEFKFVRFEAVCNNYLSLYSLCKLFESNMKKTIIDIALKNTDGNLLSACDAFMKQNSTIKLHILIQIDDINTTLADYWKKELLSATTSHSSSHKNKIKCLFHPLLTPKEEKQAKILSRASHKSKSKRKPPSLPVPQKQKPTSSPPVPQKQKPSSSPSPSSPSPHRRPRNKTNKVKHRNNNNTNNNNNNYKNKNKNVVDLTQDSQDKREFVDLTHDLDDSVIILDAPRRNSQY